MAKSAGWAAAGAVVGLVAGVALGGHPPRVLGWFLLLTGFEAVAIGGLGLWTRGQALQRAVPVPLGAEYAAAAWHSPPIIPFVVAAAGLAAVAGAGHRPELAGACAGLDGGLAVAFGAVARVYDVAERRSGRRYWAPGRGVGGPVAFTGRRSGPPGS